MRIVSAIIALVLAVFLVSDIAVWFFSAIYFAESITAVLQAKADARIWHNLLASTSGVLIFCYLFWLEMHLLVNTCGIKRQA